MAVAFDKDFSYSPVYIQLPGDRAGVAPTPLELKDQSALTPAERQQLSEILAERERERMEIEQERRRLGLDRALDEGLIEGVGFGLIGALVWIAHLLGRRALEPKDEPEGLLSRLYLLVIVVVFGVITVVSLPQAVFETMRYGLLEPMGRFGPQVQPGGKLALSIATLPIWLFYLWSAIRAVRRAP
jgi:hypothetical protein